MSGVCSVPFEKTTTAYAGTFDLNTPDALFNGCGGGQNISVTDPTSQSVTQCCPTLGPPGAIGPQGDCGAGFNWLGQWLTAIAYQTENTPSVCASDTVYNKGSSYVCILDHTSDSTNEAGQGVNWQTYWDLMVTEIATHVTWRGYWESTSISYAENDFVTHDGSSYMCVVSHTSSDDNEPTIEFDYEPGGQEWILVASGNEITRVDELENWFDGVKDWLGDIENWGLEDWLKLLKYGLGLLAIGGALLAFFADDGTGDGNADSGYDGDPLYTGAFTAPTLAATVKKLCDLVGVTSYDTSALSTIYVNFTIGNITSARNVLEMLSLVYFFDMVDSSGVLKFIPRGTQSSVRTLTRYDDLGFSNNDVPAVPVTIKRYQGAELPQRVELKYFSETTAHNQFTQTATLETYDEGQDVKIQIPLTLTDQYAYDVAETALVNAHVERSTYAITTTYKHLDLEPADIITIEDIGDVRIIRIDEDRDGGLLNITCVNAAHNGEMFTSSGIAAETPPPYTDTPPVIGYSSGFAMELPAFDISDINQRLSLVPHGYGKTDWPGCVIYYSIDGGTTYSPYTSALREATWGVVASPVASVTDYTVWDETTTISVELKTGTLSSKTKPEVYAGENWCIINDEVIGFRNAVFVSGTTYTLSGLLRGRKGTEPTISTHVADELFVLLDTAVIEFPYTNDQKDATFYFKYVTIGSDLSKATAYVVSPSNRSRTPWKVINVNASKPVNDWNITWTGRNQFNGEMVDGAPTSQPDQFGGFSLQILNPADDTVKRTIVQQITNYTYTQAQQVADFGSVQTTIKIRLNQIDLIVGPGYQNVLTF